jgi:hypothetical protein
MVCLKVKIIASEHTYKCGKAEEEFYQKTENSQCECCTSGNDYAHVLVLNSMSGSLITNIL